MKMNMVLVGLSLGLLLLCIVFVGLMGRNVNELEVLSDMTVQSILNESSDASFLLNNLRSRWEKILPGWQMLSGHTELLDMDLLLYEAESLLEDEEPIQAAFAVRSFAMALREIYRMELPLFENII